MSSMTGFRGPTGYNQGFATGSGYGGATGSMERNKIPKGYSYGQVAQYTPDQMKLFQSLLSQLGPDSYLSRLAGGDQSLFEEMEAPALRQFSGLQGNIASRFSGMGLGARHSSGFQNTMTSAASNFAQDLQSRRQDLQRQAIRDLQGMGSELLSQRPYQRTLTQKPKSFLQELLLSGVEGFGKGSGGSASGDLFSGIKSLFGG